MLRKYLDKLRVLWSGAPFEASECSKIIEVKPMDKLNYLEKFSEIMRNFDFAGFIGI